MTLHRAWTVTLLLLCVRCGGGSPSAPGGAEILAGGERFGWDQPAADAAELAGFRYATYVDDVRGEAADVSCTPSATAGRFACTCRMPAMPAGSHSLQVAAFVSDGAALLESSRSATVRVVQR